MTSVSETRWNEAAALLSRLRLLAAKKIVSNVLWLFALQALSYICPLLNVVFLTRALGPAAWGVLATFQGLASYLALVVEYGFELSATREAAQNRDDRGALQQLLASVLWAKIGLAGIAVIVVACCCTSVPILKQHLLLTICAVGVAFGPSLNPLWFYQGLEVIKLTGAINLIGRIMGTVLTVCVVQRPSEVWIALLIPGFAGFTSALINHLRLYRRYSFVLPSPALILRTLRFGWPMFLYRSSVSFYTIGNSFILALFVAPEYVGYYAAGERIARYSTSFMGPAAQAIMPRISYLVQTDAKQARIFAARCFRAMTLAGIGLGLITFASAPVIISIFLGRRFAEAVPILRILSLLPPIVAMSNVLGFYWLFPLRKDSVINAVILLAGAFNIGLAILLAPAFRDYGMAWAVVSAEAFVTISFTSYLKCKHLFPAANDCKRQLLVKTL